MSKPCGLFSTGHAVEVGSARRCHADVPDMCHMLFAVSHSQLCKTVSTTLLHCFTISTTAISDKTLTHIHCALPRWLVFVVPEEDGACE